MRKVFILFLLPSPKCPKAKKKYLQLNPCLASKTIEPQRTSTQHHEEYTVEATRYSTDPLCPDHCAWIWLRGVISFSRTNCATRWSRSVLWKKVQRDRPPPRAETPGVGSIPTLKGILVQPEIFLWRLLTWWTVCGAPYSLQHYTLALVMKKRILLYYVSEVSRDILVDRLCDGGVQPTCVCSCETGAIHLRVGRMSPLYYTCGGQQCGKTCIT